MARNKVRLRFHGTRVKLAVHGATAQGLDLAAEHLLGAAKRLVPIEEGTLERSGVASSDHAKLRAAVSFNTPYAVYQHERLDLRHNNGRTAKYLERPMTTEAVTLRRLIAARIRKRIR